MNQGIFGAIIFSYQHLPNFKNQFFQKLRSGLGSDSLTNTFLKFIDPTTPTPVLIFGENKFKKMLEGKLHSGKVHLGKVPNYKDGKRLSPRILNEVTFKQNLLFQLKGKQR